MSDAPERIYAAPPYDDPEWQSGAGDWDVSENWAAEPLVEYIRADVAAAMMAQARSAMAVAAVQKITEMWNDPDATGYDIAEAVRDVLDPPNAD